MMSINAKCCYTQFTGCSKQYFGTYYAQSMPTTSTRDSAWELNCAYGYMPSILCSNARAPVAQLVRASDQHSEDPSPNPGWISTSAFLFLFKWCPAVNLPLFCHPRRSEIQQQLWFCKVTKFEFCYMCKIIIDSRVPRSICTDIHNHE